jgi:GNAT superfamily N-acetyltransferase
MMDRTQTVSLYTRDQRMAVEYPDSRREVLAHVIRHVHLAGHGEGTIIYSQLDDRNVETAIDEQVKYFEAIGQDFEWKVYDYDTPPDLKARLAQRGFAVEEPEAIMVLDMELAADVLYQPVGHRIERVMAAEGLEDVAKIEEAVWGEDQTRLKSYLAECLERHPTQMSVYVAYLEGNPASAGWIYYPRRSRFASLWGGSTLERYRGRGLYAALLAVRVQEAKEKGVEYLTVDASPMSRPILEKYGFETISYAHACKWKVKSCESRTHLPVPEHRPPTPRPPSPATETSWAAGGACTFWPKMGRHAG